MSIDQFSNQFSIVPIIRDSPSLKNFEVTCIFLENQNFVILKRRNYLVACVILFNEFFKLTAAFEVLEIVQKTQRFNSLSALLSPNKLYLPASKNTKTVQVVKKYASSTIDHSE